jgi:hypothetical protein
VTARHWSIHLSHFFATLATVPSIYHCFLWLHATDPSIMTECCYCTPLAILRLYLSDLHAQGFGDTRIPGVFRVLTIQHYYSMLFFMIYICTYLYSTFDNIKVEANVTNSSVRVTNASSCDKTDFEMQFFEKSTECCVNQSYSRFLFIYYLFYNNFYWFTVFVLVLLNRKCMHLQYDSYQMHDRGSNTSLQLTRAIKYFKLT